MSFEWIIIILCVWLKLDDNDDDDEDFFFEMRKKVSREKTTQHG